MNLLRHSGQWDRCSTSANEGACTGARDGAPPRVEIIGRTGSRGERLELRLFVDAQHQGVVGWVEVEPNDVAHLVDKQRVSRQLEGLDAVRLQSKGPPDAPRLEVEMPLCRAMLRVLQCVAPAGRLSSVCTMTFSTLASSIGRGAPGRGSSSSPSRSRSTKRRRTQPLLPMRPGQVERRSHDDQRHGTTSLLAALDIATGRVIGRCYQRHRARH